MALTGANTGMNILPTAAGSIDSGFPIGDIAVSTAGYNTMTVASGSLTVEKDASTPSGTIGIGSANTTLAAFKFEAKGEDIEVRQLVIEIDGSGIAAGDFSGTVRLVAEDGTQIVQTPLPQPIYCQVLQARPFHSLLTTQFQPEHLRRSAWLLTLQALWLLQISLMARSNASTSKKVLTNSYDTYSSGTWIPGNTLTASQGTLSVSKNASLGSSTKVEGQSGVKIGSYLLQTNATEGVNVSSIGVKLAASDTTLDNKVSNLKH